ncbi:urea transporter [Shewanella sp. 125m-7]
MRDNTSIRDCFSIHDNYVTYCLRGTSQVFFMENAFTGVLFFIAMGYASYDSGHWSTTFGALLGVLVATATAMITHGDKDMTKSGLYGFNGILVGAALPTFIAPSIVLWLFIIIGAAFSTVVTNAFKNILTNTLGIPGSTGPFVLCGWLFMISAYSFGHLDVSMFSNPSLPTDYLLGRTAVPSLPELIAIFFRNIGQVYLLGSAVSGAIMLLGIFIASVPAGIAASLGSLIAIVFSVMFGANPDVIHAGLYGFSPVLTAMAVGVIFISPSWRSAIYALFATIVTVVLQGALDVFMEPDGLPSFTSPYVLTMYLFIAAKNIIEPAASNVSGNA